MKRIEIDNLDQLIELYEAGTISDKVCLSTLEAMLKSTIIIFTEPDGSYIGGKEIILKNLKLLAEQISQGHEKLLFINLPNE